MDLSKIGAAALSLLSKIVDRKKFIPFVLKCAKYGGVSMLGYAVANSAESGIADFLLPSFVTACGGVMEWLRGKKDSE